jgi:hypothetical protein
MEYTQTESGIVVPTKKPVGVRCGYCPVIIFKQNESNGRLFMFRDLPICARCRILKGSKFANKIRIDKARYEKGIENKEKQIQADADAKVRELAQYNPIESKK